MADMQELIARLEAAEAGSRELDALVWKAINPKGEIAIKGAGRPGLVDWRCRIPGATIANSWTNPGRYSTSLDAALALAERTGFGDCFDIQIRPGTARVSRFADGRAVWMLTPDCATPALALCIAILKAKAQGEGG